MLLRVLLGVWPAVVEGLGVDRGIGDRVELVVTEHHPRRSTVAHRLDESERPELTVGLAVDQVTDEDGGALGMMVHPVPVSRVAELGQQLLESFDVAVDITDDVVAGSVERRFGTVGHPVIVPWGTWSLTTPAPETLPHRLVTMGTVNVTLEDQELACACLIDRGRTRTERFMIAPSRGGGWSAWAEAFTRLIDRLASLPAHCVVVTQDPNQRYVQLMVGHGRAHIEVSSNEYLLGDFRLDPGEEAFIETLGFERPDPVSNAGWPLNWWRNERPADSEAIAGLVLVASTTVLGFDDRHEITIDVFGADHPCDACAWGD